MSIETQLPTPACPVCASLTLTDCIRISGVPVHCNRLHDTRRAALAAPRGEIDLVFCDTCGHLFNSAFSPACVAYSGEYENSLHFSGRFQEYALSLARHLVDLHDLRGKSVLEIACGQGDFLRLICALGDNQGIGFDPSHVPGRSEGVDSANPTFVREYYSVAHAGQRADLICCRHALEHMARPAAFLRMLRRAIGDSPSAVYFEVPNALFTLDDLGIWDIIYEHCGYFWSGSLRQVFERSGFFVDRVESAFGGQFLALHGRASAAVEPEPDPAAVSLLATKAARFAVAYAQKVVSWRSRVTEVRERGRRLVVWGAGSKGVSFINTLGIGDEVECLIDLNPRKHGRFIPGTGHQVRSPQTLAGSRPDGVIVMNPLYADEIRAQLHGMGIDAEILVEEPR